MIVNEEDEQNESTLNPATSYLISSYSHSYLHRELEAEEEEEMLDSDSSSNQFSEISRHNCCHSQDQNRSCTFTLNKDENESFERGDKAERRLKKNGKYNQNQNHSRSKEEAIGIGMKSGIKLANFFILSLLFLIPTFANSEPAIDGVGWERPGMPKITHLEVMCGSDHMEVHISFDSPFTGIIASKGMYGQEGCVYVLPRSGNTNYVFNIYYDKCGTKPDNHGKFYENTIVVQYDEQLIEAFDEAKRLRCEWFNDYEKTATKTSPMVISDLEVVELNFHGDNVDVWMEIQEGKGPFAPPLSNIVALGSTLTMVIAIKDPGGQFDMRVKQCEASDGKNGHILQLSDLEGCIVRPKLMGKFSKIKMDDGRATVLTYAFINAFKFPDMLNIFLRCTVEICRHGCPEHCSPLPALPPPHSIPDQSLQHSLLEPIAYESEVKETKVSANTYLNNKPTPKGISLTNQNNNDIETGNHRDSSSNGFEPNLSLEPQPLGPGPTLFPYMAPPPIPYPQKQRQRQTPHSHHSQRYPRPPQPARHPTHNPASNPFSLHVNNNQQQNNFPNIQSQTRYNQQQQQDSSYLFKEAPRHNTGSGSESSAQEVGSIENHSQNVETSRQNSQSHHAIMEESSSLRPQQTETAASVPTQQKEENTSSDSNSNEDQRDKREEAQDNQPKAEQLKDESQNGGKETVKEKRENKKEETIIEKTTSKDASKGFPKGPRNLRHRRSVNSNQDVIGVEGLFRVVSQADLNFAINSSALEQHSPTEVLRGKMIDVTYGICLPRIGFISVFLGLGLSSLVAILIAVFLVLAHYQMTQSAKNRGLNGCNFPQEATQINSVPVFPMIIFRKML